MNDRLSLLLAGVLSPLVLLLVLLSAPLSPLRAAEFIRGDVDASGNVNVTDAVAILRFLFAGDMTPAACLDAADVDDSGSTEITDAVSLLAWLFRGGDAPAAPFPACGRDPTDDDLACVRFGPCDRSFTFLGRELESGLVIFVVDGAPGSTAVGVFKIVAPALIESLPETTELAILTFGERLRRFPLGSSPTPATPLARSKALAHTEHLRASAGSCPQEALLEAFDIAAASEAPDPVILYISDGLVRCSGFRSDVLRDAILTEIPQRNDADVVIHTFGTALFPTAVDTDFLFRLAGSTGGSFTLVDARSL